jgi:hypothetical protein
MVGLVAGGFGPSWTNAIFPVVAFGVAPILTGVFLFLGRREAAAQPAQGSPQAEALSAAHRLPPRRGKLLLRFLPTAVFVGTFIQGLRIGGVIGYGAAALAASCIAWITFAYRRRGPQRQPCHTCPERFEMHRCRGFQEIRHRERAFQRLAGWMIQHAGN